MCIRDSSFPELTAERESVLEELATVSSGPDALTELKVGASLAAEVERNTRLLTEPAQPAIRTYTGVLFEALDYASFSPAERDAAHWSLLISSALWGILRPEDVYKRQTHDQRLPLLNGGGNVLGEAAVGFHGVPVGGAFFPGAGGVLPARGAGEAKVHDGHPVGQGAQCRVGGGESADQDGVAHGFSLETSGWVPSPCQG